MPDPTPDDHDVTVTLQLGRPTHIAGLTIGTYRSVIKHGVYEVAHTVVRRSTGLAHVAENAGSAFIEVLVGKSSWPPSELFQVQARWRSAISVWVRHHC